MNILLCRFYHEIFKIYFGENRGNVKTTNIYGLQLKLLSIQDLCMQCSVCFAVVYGMDEALLYFNLQIPSKYLTNKAHVIIIAQTGFVSEKSTISYLNKPKKPGSIVISFCQQFLPSAI